MEITGKCKEAFEKWLNDIDWLEYDLIIRIKGLIDSTLSIKEAFIGFPQSMKYSVYEDFFDSVGINIEITNDNKELKTFWVDINNEQVDEGDLNTRPEAREEAIKKANEIFNNR